MEIKNIKPLLVNELDFYTFDKDTYLLQQKVYSHQLRINKSTYNLLKLIDGHRTIETITELHNAENTVKISVQDLYKVLYERFAQWGIIQHDIPVIERQKDGYLLLRFTIIPEIILKKITPFFSFLFNQKYFFIIFLLLALFASTDIYTIVCKQLSIYS